jgi:methionyl-tRNA formyltransferase
MRIAFAGTPEFARASLAALHAAGHELLLVLTQPDRPAGRGLKVQPSPVKSYAIGKGLPLAQPRSLRLDGRWPEDAAATQQQLRTLAPDVLVVAAYGLILPRWAIELPRRGCINVHASLLPRWRGAAPIQRAIEAGDASTGITIMRMDEGLDTGPMLLAEPLPIAADETSASLHDRLAALGAELIVRALSGLDRLEPRAQPAEGATYAKKIDKSEASIDWSQPATVIERRVRAFDPHPGCSFTWRGDALKLWRAKVIDGPGSPAAPGAPFEPGPGRLAFVCGTGALELLQVQAAGGRRLAMADYLRGR